LLIVNADDFGLTAGVCRAIHRAHTEGIVTSTSVLAIAPGFAGNASLLDDTALGIGVHLAAVGEDPPLLTAAEIPTLVDKRGHLPYSWRQFLPKIAARRIDIDDVDREFRAQAELVIGTVGAGRVTHLDTHQHLHLWPRIGALVCRIAGDLEIPAIRVTQSDGASPKSRGVNALARRLRDRAQAAAIRTPDAFAGFDEAGGVGAAELVATIDRLGATAAPTAEIGVHPGEHGDGDLVRYEWGYRWADELDGLVAPESRAAVARAGFELGSFAALSTGR
jgi:predicted glycoside hydrolase/deacetylase ChbG (UPF0249 family)